jgi:hypothetical protein
MTTYSKSYGATAYLTFNDTQIALTAKNISKPVFEYHADSFYTAASLGQIGTAIASIATKMGDVLGDTAVKDIEDEINKAKDIPVLGQIIESELVITDFVINTPDKVYEFGLGLRLTEDNKLGPITLDGISILVKMTGKEE